MKKLLLSMAAVTLIGGTAMADSFDVTFSKNDWPNVSAYNKTNESTTEFGGTTWTTENFNNNNGAWGYIRCGAKASNGITTGSAAIYTNSALADKVTSVVVNVPSATKNGTITSAILMVADDDTFSNATSYAVDEAISAAGAYTFTVTTPAAGKFYKLSFDYSNSTSSNGVMDIDKVTVNYEIAADALAAPVITMVDGAEGYQVVMTAEEGADIYYTENETEPTTASPKYTKPLEVWMKTTFKAIAVKDGKTSSVATFTAVPPTVVPDFMSLYGFVDYISSAGEEVEVRSNMVAVYDYLAPAGGYLYLYDGQNYMLFYKSPVPTEAVAPGTTYDKVEGLFKVYNGLPEMTNYTLGEPTGTTGTVPAPTMLELDAVGANMVNHYIKVEDVKVEIKVDEDNKTTITATDKDGNSVALYDRFGLDIKDLDSADITGFVSVFGDTVQIYPTLIVENENTGVADIAVDNSAAEYYTLQGVRVANPENGIYIVRQGGKVFKTVIK